MGLHKQAFNKCVYSTYFPFGMTNYLEAIFKQYDEFGNNLHRYRIDESDPVNYFIERCTWTEDDIREARTQWLAFAKAHADPSATDYFLPFSYACGVADYIYTGENLVVPTGKRAPAIHDITESRTAFLALGTFFPYGQGNWDVARYLTFTTEHSPAERHSRIDIPEAITDLFGMPAGVAAVSTPSTMMRQLKHLMVSPTKIPSNRFIFNSGSLTTPNIVLVYEIGRIAGVELLAGGVHKRVTVAYLNDPLAKCPFVGSMNKVQLDAFLAESGILSINIAADVVSFLFNSTAEAQFVVPAASNVGNVGMPLYMSLVTPNSAAGGLVTGPWCATYYKANNWDKTALTPRSIYAATKYMVSPATNSGPPSFIITPAVFGYIEYGESRQVIAVTRADKRVYQSIGGWCADEDVTTTTITDRQATATATISGGAVTGFTGLPSGSGYTSPPPVSFSLPSSGGIPAEGTAVITDGVVTAITLSTGGTLYGVAPTVVIGAPPSLTFDKVAPPMSAIALTREWVEDEIEMDVHDGLTIRDRAMLYWDNRGVCPFGSINGPLVATPAQLWEYGNLNNRLASYTQLFVDKAYFTSKGEFIMCPSILALQRRQMRVVDEIGRFRLYLADGTAPEIISIGPSSGFIRYMGANHQFSGITTHASMSVLADGYTVLKFGIWAHADAPILSADCALTTTQAYGSVLLTHNGKLGPIGPFQSTFTIGYSFTYHPFALKSLAYSADGIGFYPQGLTGLSDYLPTMPNTGGRVATNNSLAFKPELGLEFYTQRIMFDSYTTLPYPMAAPTWSISGKQRIVSTDVDAGADMQIPAIETFLEAWGLFDEGGIECPYRTVVFDKSAPYPPNPGFVGADAYDYLGPVWTDNRAYNKGFTPVQHETEKIVSYANLASGLPNMMDLYPVCPILRVQFDRFWVNGALDSSLVPSNNLPALTPTFAMMVLPGELKKILHNCGPLLKCYNLNQAVGTVSGKGNDATYFAKKEGFDVIVGVPEGDGPIAFIPVVVYPTNVWSVKVGDGVATSLAKTAFTIAVGSQQTARLIVGGIVMATSVEDVPKATVTSTATFYPQGILPTKAYALSYAKTLKVLSLTSLRGLATGAGDAVLDVAGDVDGIPGNSILLLYEEPGLNANRYRLYVPMRVGAGQLRFFIPQSDILRQKQLYGDPNNIVAAPVKFTLIDTNYFTRLFVLLQYTQTTITP